MDCFVITVATLWSGKTMVSVPQANLISCLIGFVLSCFYKSNFSCSLLWLEWYSRSFYWALTLSINARVADRAAIEPDRGVKSEVGSRKSEVGSRKSEVRSGKLEVRSGKWEVRSLTMQHWLNRQKSEIQSSNFVKSEVWNLKYEVWSRKSEVGSRKSEARSRKTLLGFRNTQIEQNYDFYVFRGCTLQNNFFVLTWKQKTTIYLHCRVINNNSYCACDWQDLKTLSKCEQQYRALLWKKYCLPS